MHHRPQAFRQAGFKVVKGGASWTVMWGRPADILTEDILKAMRPFQRINHFPGERCCGTALARVHGMCAWSKCMCLYMRYARVHAGFMHQPAVVAASPAIYTLYVLPTRLWHTCFTGTWELGRKDRLYRNIAAARRAKGSTFDIIPRCFVLPGDAGAFKTELEHHPGA